MNDDNYLYKATIQVTEKGLGRVIKEDRKPSLIRDGYGTLDTSKIMVHEDDLLTTNSEPVFYMSDVPKESDIKGYKCPNCGCAIMIIHDGKADEDFYCPFCNEKLNQPGDNYNEL